MNKSVQILRLLIATVGLWLMVPAMWGHPQARSSCVINQSVTEVVINFDALDTSAAPGTLGGAALDNYLASFGVTLTDVANGPVTVQNANFAYGGGVVGPTSPPNYLQQSGTACSPTSFILRVAQPVDQVRFTFAAILLPSVVPQWSATALDSAGNPLSSVGNGLTSGVFLARTYSLNGPGISAIRFDGFGFCFAAWPGPLIDDLTLVEQGSPEFQINVTTFIPGNSITGPPQSRCGRGEQLFFAGDDRGFNPSSDSFRTRQLVTVTTEESMDAHGLREGSAQNLVGETRSYAPDALPTIDAADDDGVLNDCHLLHERATASNSKMHIDVSRIDAHSVSVHLFGSVGNPLINLPDRIKAIDWDFTITIDTSGRRPRWTLQGVDDGFPAFEIYINNNPIYTRNAPPPYTFQDLLKLLPSQGDVLVSLSGDLP